MMAVLQIHVVRARLDKRINYVMNPEKTACKGFHSFFGIKDTLTSGFTCACDEAYQQMMETKHMKIKQIKSSDTITFSRLNQAKLRRRKHTKSVVNLSSDASQKILKL